MNLTIKTIPHSEQLYPTVGNWITSRNKLEGIEVSDMGNPDYEILVAVHELIESYLCLKNKITQRVVDKFDKAYEKARAKKIAAPCGCYPTDVSEPGNDHHAPYRVFHHFATGLEKSLADQLGVDWDAYDRKVNSL
jgi:hypothetical protein